MGHLFLLIGPDGVGKTSIIREVMARRPSVRFLPTRSGVLGILAVDIAGGLEIKRVFGSSTTTICIRPSSTDDLLARLALRGDPQEDIQRRMERAREELRMADRCDTVVVNQQGRLEEAVEAVLAIIDRVANTVAPI